ncbi:MAG: hypothetical protein ACJARR_003360 [Pseudophaeobacter arcticus]
MDIGGTSEVYRICGGSGERLGGAAVSVRKRYIQNEQVIILIFVE